MVLCMICAFLCALQAGILAVGRGNKVVEPVTGADGRTLIIFSEFESDVWVSKITFIHQELSIPQSLTK